MHAVLLVLASSPLAAQEDEPVFAELERLFKRPYLSVGVLVQAVADLQIERAAPGQNGFSLANARLNVGGHLDAGFGYFLQANFINTPTVLDAWGSWRFTPSLEVLVGQTKAPFSHEFLTVASSIDFVNRAQVVSALAPGRQLGAQLAIGRRESTVGLSVGVFNGNGFAANGNDGDGFLAVGRLTASLTPGEGATLLLGGNIGYAEDDAAPIPGITASFNGERALVGADGRFTSGPLLVSGEVIYSRLEVPAGAVFEPWGFHATGGYMLSAKSQLLFRWDRLDPDIADATDLLIFGLNVWPTKATEIQVNYLIDTDASDFDNHQVLVNFQVGF